MCEFKDRLKYIEFCTSFKRYSSIEVTAGQRHLLAPFGERPSLNPLPTGVRVTPVGRVEALHPYFLKLTDHNSRSSLEETEGGIRGFFVLVFNGLR